MTTIYNEAVRALASDPELKVLYRALSDGDLSVLWLALDDDTARVSTVPGSMNSQFWHCLAEYGWMAEFDPPSLKGIEILGYRITDQGYRAIPVVLSKLRAAGSSA